PRTSPWTPWPTCPPSRAARTRGSLRAGRRRAARLGGVIVFRVGRQSGEGAKADREDTRTADGQTDDALDLAIRRRRIREGPEGRSAVGGRRRRCGGRGDGLGRLGRFRVADRPGDRQILLAPPPTCAPGV